MSDFNSSETPNSSDSISRQEAIDELIKMLWGCFQADEELVDAVVTTIKELPSAREIIHCKDCRKRDTEECPMRHVEHIMWEEDGYVEVDNIIHDYTESYGFCERGEQDAID